jgi:hypothetical protein
MFPSKEALPEVPFMESLTQRCPTHYSPPSFIYQSPRYTSPPHIPGSPRVERGPHGERCPHPETFLTFLPGAPVKELPLRSPQYHIISHHISYRIISYHTISFDKYLETLKQAFTVYILTVFKAVCFDKS